MTLEQDSGKNSADLKNSAAAGQAAAAGSNSAKTQPVSTIPPQPDPKPDDPPRQLLSSLSSQATSAARLDAFFKSFHSDDRVLVVISADPDAIASAVSIKRLLWRKVSHVCISSINQMKRPDNLQLIEILKLKLEIFKAIKLENFTRLVMVDSQPGHSPQTENLNFDVIIDHHPNSFISSGQLYPGYVDIRPEFGATATMMTAYLKSAKIKPNHRLATALFYAIKTDTGNFARQGQLEDMIAFRWLYPLINPQLLAEIETAPIARSSFPNIVTGLEKAVLNKNNAHTFLGRTDHADTLVIVADFLMQIKDINRSSAAGICDSKLVVILRGNGPRLNVGDLAERAFAEFGSAGGHKTMARAEMPLENLDPKIRDNDKALARFVMKRLIGE